MKKKKKNSKQFNKKFKKQFFTVKSVTIIVLTVVILLFLGMGGIHQKRKADQYKKTIEELTSEVNQIKETNKALEEEKDHTDSDEFKEKIAREKLGMVDQDEYALKESDGQEEADGNSTSQEETADTENSEEDVQSEEP